MKANEQRGNKSSEASKGALRFCLCKWFCQAMALPSVAKSIHQEGGESPTRPEFHDGWTIECCETLAQQAASLLDSLEWGLVFCAGSGTQVT